MENVLNKFREIDLPIYFHEFFWAWIFKKFLSRCEFSKISKIISRQKDSCIFYLKQRIPNYTIQN